VLSLAEVDESASGMLEELDVAEVEERPVDVSEGSSKNEVRPAKLSRRVAEAGVGRSIVSDTPLK
jgi:hypothetical protein